jgi:hypothetical protein
MGLRLSFDAFDDIRSRCDVASVRRTRCEPGYDDSALVPDGPWTPLTPLDAETFCAGANTPDSVLIELVRRPLPALSPTDDIRRYAAEGHPLRCVGIRLAPGDGYIAPTELLPHDGSTASSDSPSVVGFWLGRPAENRRTCLRVCAGRPVSSIEPPRGPRRTASPAGAGWPPTAAARTGHYRVPQRDCLTDCHRPYIGTCSCSTDLYRC